MIIITDYKTRQNQRNNILKIWKQRFGNDEFFCIPYNTDNFAVSNYGRVKNLLTKRILKQRQSSNGYNVVSMRINGKIQTVNVHRIVAETFFGVYGLQNPYEVNHIDGDTLNNHIENLEYVTRHENIQHAIVNKLYWKNKRKQFTKTVINDIIEFKRLGFKVQEIADSYNVNEKYIYKLLKENNV